jgi:hypothetical protein
MLLDAEVCIDPARITSAVAKTGSAAAVPGKGVDESNVKDKDRSAATPIQRIASAVRRPIRSAVGVRAISTPTRNSQILVTGV